MKNNFLDKMKTVRSIPQYTTILSQAISPCGSLYAAATVDGFVNIWKTSQLFSVDTESPPSPIAQFRVKSGVNSLLSTQHYLLIGEKDKVTGYDWSSITDNEVQQPSWDMCLPQIGEVNSMVEMGEDDSKIVIGAGDNNVYLVDVETRTRCQVLTGHSNYVHSVARCDSALVSGGEDGSVRFWDIKQQQSVHCITPSEQSELARPKLGKHISSVSVTNDWMAAGGGPAPALWHLKSMSMSTTLPCNNNEVKVVMIHDDTVTVGGRGRILHQTSITGELKAEIAMSSSVIYSVANKSNPNIMCCTGSSSYIDILTNNYNYKDATIQFHIEE